MWGGPAKDAIMLPLVGPATPTATTTTEPNVLIDQYLKYWLYENPAFDWHTVTRSSMEANINFSRAKFDGTASTDSTDLDKVRAKGAKIIHYHGTADPVVVPFGSYNYLGRMFDRYGVAGTQSFMRSFFYPGVGHCGGGAAPQPDADKLFGSLRDWVEKGTAPDYVVAAQTLSPSVVRTRKVCKYPDVAVYKGTGSTDDEASFSCQVNAAVPPALAADAKTNDDRK
jgi:feruloyl esterase